MTPRERVLAAVQHRPPDRCPMDFGGTEFAGCNAVFLARLREILGFSLPEDRDADGSWVDEQIQRYLDVDIRLVPQRIPLAVLRQIAPEEHARRMDERRRPPAAPRRERRNALGEVIQNDLGIADAELADILKLKPRREEPPAHLDWLVEHARRQQAAGFATSFFFVGGYFEWGCWTRGFSQFCMDLVSNQDLVRALWDVWEQEKMHRLETVIRPLARHVDLFLSGDDFGTQAGPFMSPEVFGSLIVPYYRRLYGRLKEIAPRAHVMHHSCGSVYRLLDGFLAMGVEVLNPIQPAAADMEPEKLKAAGRGRICFHGGIDLQDLLPRGTPEEVRREASRRM